MIAKRDLLGQISFYFNLIDKKPLKFYIVYVSLKVFLRPSRAKQVAGILAKRLGQSDSGAVAVRSYGINLRVFVGISDSGGRNMGGLRNDVRLDGSVVGCRSGDSRLSQFAAGKRFLERIWRIYPRQLGAGSGNNIRALHSIHRYQPYQIRDCKCRKQIWK